MKKLIILFIVAAAISLLAGIASRVILVPFIFGLEANAFLRFANTCLFFAIALSLMQPSKLK